MSEFLEIKAAIQEQIEDMQREYTNLFVADVSKEELWDTYLGSFRQEHNPLFKERTEHDCQCCKQFIRRVGGLVAITEDLRVISIWDVLVGYKYDRTVEKMAALVKSRPIRNKFISSEKKIGTDFNLSKVTGQEVVQWDHFYCELPDRFVSTQAGTDLSEARSSYDVLKRGLTELSLDGLRTVRGLTELSLDGLRTVKGLIAENSIYRGEEHSGSVDNFITLKEGIPEENFDLYAWKNSSNPAARFKNSVIGTLVSDLSEGVDITKAVKKYEAKVAPENYKRTKSLVTPAMISRAKEKVTQLGLMDSLPRRHAKKEDINVSDVIFADQSFQEQTDIFQDLTKKAEAQNLKGLEGALEITAEKFLSEITAEKFLSEILPKSKSLELLVENRLEHNLVSLLSPVNPEASGLFKWASNFSWAYNGDVADSMKDRVKAAGGKTQGALRFSIQWNDAGNNNFDLDAHAFSEGSHIFFENKGKRHRNSGMLDVDIQRPGEGVAVENIIYADLSKLPDGEYDFKVLNYEQRPTNEGFSAEVEFGGTIHSFNYSSPLKGKEFIDVAVVTKAGGQLKIGGVLSSRASQRKLWGITTQTFCKVALVMNSPNHWGRNETGNKHLFFILEGCNSGQEARGFYSEFLRNDLHETRKTFELLGSEMKAPKTSEELSGLGFSSTQENYVYCKVDGNRKYKLTF